jgi:hypothetical protein
MQADREKYYQEKIQEDYEANGTASCSLKK